MSVKEINFQELKGLLEDDETPVELIDVREPFEYADSHFIGAKSIPMSLVPIKMNEIDFDKKVVVYCRSGARSRMIADMLAKQGKDVINLKGGMLGVERGSELVKWAS